MSFQQHIMPFDGNNFEVWANSVKASLLISDALDSIDPAKEAHPPDGWDKIMARGWLVLTGSITPAIMNRFHQCKRYGYLRFACIDETATSKAANHTFTLMALLPQIYSHAKATENNALLEELRQTGRRFATTTTNIVDSGNKTKGNGKSKGSDKSKMSGSGSVPAVQTIPPK